MKRLRATLLLLVGTLAMAALLAVRVFLPHHDVPVPKLTVSGEPRTQNLQPTEPRTAASPAPGESPGASETLALTLGALDAPGNLDPSHLPSMTDLARDPHGALQRRVRAIRWLARLGDAEAFAVLEGLIETDPHPTILLQAASALADCPHPGARDLLESLLEDPRDVVVVGALRALDARGESERIRAILFDPERSVDVRAAAASALGGDSDASATAVLLETWNESEDADLAAGVLTGLGRRPFIETQEYFDELVNRPNLRVEHKVEALDALGEGSAEAADFLLGVAFDHPEEAVRIAAVEALSSLEDPGHGGGRLGELLRRDEAHGVRAAAYSALTLHARAWLEPGELSAFLPEILDETAPDLRLRAYGMAASALHAHPDPQLGADFDVTMVPWLRQEAEQGDAYARSLAVSALGLAGTPGADDALGHLASSSQQDTSRSANKALEIKTRTRRTQ